MKKIFLAAILLSCGFMCNHTKAELHCDGILVSCGVAAGCWDDEMTLEEYADLATMVDAEACH